MADRLPEERGLARLHLHHPQFASRATARHIGIAGEPPPDPMSMCWNDAAVGRYRAARTGSRSRRSMRLIAVRQGSQVDLAVPAREQLEVRDETIGELVVEEEARAGSPLLQSASRISRARPRDYQRAAGRGERSRYARDHGHGRRRHARNVRGLPEGLRSDRGEPLDHLAREARDPGEREIPRNAARLLRR